jgi:hypothetical protein
MKWQQTMEIGAKMQEITKNVNMYKSIKKNGYTDFPMINARVLYYYDHWTNQEYAITINLNNKNNVIDVERFNDEN